MSQSFRFGFKTAYALKTSMYLQMQKKQFVVGDTVILFHGKNWGE